MYKCVCVCSVAHSCPTLCNLTDCSLPSSFVHGIFRQEYWSGLPFPPPGIFLTQGLNLCLLGLLYCRKVLYCCTTKEPHMCVCVCVYIYVMCIYIYVTCVYVTCVYMLHVYIYVTCIYVTCIYMLHICVYICKSLKNIYSNYFRKEVEGRYSKKGLSQICNLFSLKEKDKKS